MNTNGSSLTPSIPFFHIRIRKCILCCLLLSPFSVIDYLEAAPRTADSRGFWSNPITIEENINKETGETQKCEGFLVSRDRLLLLGDCRGKEKGKFPSHLSVTSKCNIKHPYYYEGLRHVRSSGGDAEIITVPFDEHELNCWISSSTGLTVRENNIPDTDDEDIYLADEISGDGAGDSESSSLESEEHPASLKRSVSPEIGKFIRQQTGCDDIEHLCLKPEEKHLNDQEGSLHHRLMHSVCADARHQEKSCLLNHNLCECYSVNETHDPAEEPLYLFSLDKTQRWVEKGTELNAHEKPFKFRAEITDSGSGSEVGLCKCHSKEHPHGHIGFTLLDTSTPDGNFQHQCIAKNSEGRFYFCDDYPILMASYSTQTGSDNYDYIPLYVTVGVLGSVAVIAITGGVLYAIGAGAVIAAKLKNAYRKVPQHEQHAAPRIYTGPLGKIK